MSPREFRSGMSVMSSFTNKSSLSRLSRKDLSQDAVLISQATAQAVEAARAILNAGGSEMTALKTAKAAAISALMPEVDSRDESASGIGSSFLRRRKLKRHAEVVASMALASAMANGGCKAGANAVTDWEKQLTNDPTHSVTLSSSSKGSKGSERQGSSNLPKEAPKKRQSAAEMISQQLRLIPTLAATFSGNDNVNAMTRQVSSFTENTRESTRYHHLTTPHNVRVRRKYPNHYHHHHHSHGHRQDNCMIFPHQSNCGHGSYSHDDDGTTEGSEYFAHGGAVDNIMMSIASVLTCGGPNNSHGYRPREVRVPIIDEEDEEYGDSYDEETITFDGVHDVESRDSITDAETQTEFGTENEEERTKPIMTGPSLMDSEENETTNDEEDAEEEEEEEEKLRVLDVHNNPERIEHRRRSNESGLTLEQAIEAEAIAQAVSDAEADAANTDDAVSLADSESIAEILDDLMAIDTPGISMTSSKLPPVITSDPTTIELEVQETMETMDDEESKGLEQVATKSTEMEEHDENSNYVEIVAPHKRSRRLTRGCKKLGGGITPLFGNSSDVKKSPSGGVKGMFRKWRK